MNAFERGGCLCLIDPCCVVEGLKNTHIDAERYGNVMGNFDKGTLCSYPNDPQQDIYGRAGYRASNKEHRGLA